MKITTRRIAPLLLLAGLFGLAAPASAQQIVTCESNDHERNYCRADTRDGVVLVHQRSRAGCYQNSTWGYNRSGIWVANGCRATFRTGYDSHDRSHSVHYNHRSSRDVDWRDRNEVRSWERDHRDEHEEKVGKAVGAALAIGVLVAAAKQANDRDDEYGRRSVVLCESDHDGYRYCSVAGHFRHVDLKRQLSRTSCRYNRNWGYDRRGIWVDDGCRAEFWVE